MQQITDWAALWKELVELKALSRNMGMEMPGDHDFWQTKARQFNERVKKRWEKPDSTRRTILSILDPHATILDIGAGTGSWALLFAQHGHRVTAIEPSQAMREILQENIAQNQAADIAVLAEKWPEADPEVHDYAFCSHAMYGVADFPAFVRRMMARSRKMCFLLIRAPSAGGLITEAFQHVWNQPHDSPNFTVAYNILLQMGIYANVQLEDAEKWFFQTSASVDEALLELKKRLGLRDNPTHDAYLRDLLLRRLEKQPDGQYLWPGRARSALVYWPVKS